MKKCYIKLELHEGALAFIAKMGSKEWRSSMRRSISIISASRNAWEPWTLSASMARSSTNILRPGRAWRTALIAIPTRCPKRQSQVILARFSYVARIDNRDPDRDRLIAEARSHRGCLGLRVDQPSRAEMADDGYGAFFRAVMEHNVPTWVVLPGRLEELHPYLDALPDLPLIIDHAGLLERGENSRVDPFRGIDALNEARALRKVAVKWGHVTEWSAKPFPYEDALDQLRRVVDAFGAVRVMWESDWTQTLGYQTLAEMFFSIKLSDRFTVDEKAYLLGRTALEVMRWDRPRVRS